MKMSFQSSEVSKNTKWYFRNCWKLGKKNYTSVQILYALYLEYCFVSLRTWQNLESAEENSMSKGMKLVLCKKPLNLLRPGAENFRLEKSNLRAMQQRFKKSLKTLRRWVGTHSLSLPIHKLMDMK